MADWDAAKYHRISDPQLAWGRAVAARLAPVAGERILDVGRYWRLNIAARKRPS